MSCWGPFVSLCRVRALDVVTNRVLQDSACKRHNIEYHLNADLANLAEWFNKNYLTLNTSKSKFVRLFIFSIVFLLFYRASLNITLCAVSSLYKDCYDYDYDYDYD